MAGLDQYCTAFGEPAGYLNFASYGPPSRPVVEALTATAEAALRGEPGLHDQDERALAAVARRTGFPREACALATSTSAGLQQIAFGLGPEHELLVGRAEFPANQYPWWRAREAGLLKVRTYPPTSVHHQDLETLADALTPATTAVALSAVDFRTGRRADLRQVRDVIGDRLLIVDGIQGFGVVEQDWTLADALVVGGQKWLRAGWGTGFLALSPRGRERIRPTLGGWTGVESPYRYDGEEHPVLGTAQRMSVTNLSPFTAAALATALELLEQGGPAAVARRIEQTATALIDALDEAGIEVLSPREPGERAGIVVARTARPREVAGELAHEGVTVTAHDPDRIRISVHATTDPSGFGSLVKTFNDGRP